MTKGAASLFASARKTYADVKEHAKNKKAGKPTDITQDGTQQPGEKKQFFSSFKNPLSIKPAEYNESDQKTSQTFRSISKQQNFQHGMTRVNDSYLFFVIIRSKENTTPTAERVATEVRSETAVLVRDAHHAAVNPNAAAMGLVPQISTNYTKTKTSNNTKCIQRTK